MPARRENDPIGNFSFIVDINGIALAGFSRVEGLESTTEIITYINGQDNSLRKIPGRTTYSNITLYRGLTTNNELWEWRQSIIDGQFDRKSGSIVLLDEVRQEVLRYNFYQGWPCRWKVSALDASEHGMVIEELELAVEKIELAK